jgi:hypothetical protein
LIRRKQQSGGQLRCFDANALVEGKKEVFFMVKKVADAPM